MKTLIALAFAVTSLSIAMATPASAITSASAACRNGTAPESWKRPGGFCAATEEWKSMATSNEPPPPPCIKE